MKAHHSKSLKILIAYYGMLQTLHLLALFRAGIILLQGSEVPFPILPPPAGWQDQSMGFMFGLAGMDILGIILGIVFSLEFVLKHKLMPLTGIISLTIFISGAVVFASGTIPSGAWAAHPLAYWIMVLLFVPSIFLFLKLLNFSSPG